MRVSARLRSPREGRWCLPAPVIVIALAVALIPRWARADDGDRGRDRFVDDQRGIMTVLGGWSLGSISAGIAMAAAGSGRIRAAGIQNVAWGAIDGGLAVFGLASASRASRQTGPDEQWRAERASLKRIFLVNVVLDILYVGTGASLAAFAKTDALRGAGSGILVQGGFLLGLDSAGTRLMRARP